MGKRARGLVTKIVKDSYGIGVWKAIKKEWNMVAGRISFVVDNGRRVLFSGPLQVY